MKQPVTMKIRKNIRDSVERFTQLQLKKGLAMPDSPLLLVALSGGADSLALAIAAAAEANSKSAPFRAGAVIVEHGLQEETVEVSQQTAKKARELGLSPVIIMPVTIEASGLGAEGDARAARYEAFRQARNQAGAHGILIGHTMNDQAEQVLLGMARGSGARSTAGIAEIRKDYIRPMLSITRAETEAVCAENSVEYWTDPHNSLDEYTRVRIRQNVMPVLEAEIGEHIISNLANTAKLAREDADALDFIANEKIAELLVKRSGEVEPAFEIARLEKLPVGIRSRMYRKIALDFFGATLLSSHCESADKLVTAWNGQQTIHLSKCKVLRSDGLMVFSRE